MRACRLIPALELVGSGLRTMPNASEVDRSAARYSSGLVRTAGQLCCIAGPVTSGLVHPLGGSSLVQAEEVSEDRGGELGGEVEQRGTAPGLGVDTEGPQAFAEPGRG